MELNNFTVETHQGPFLNLNEDGYHFDFEQSMFMVFDGYGGSNIGDKAVEQLKIDMVKFFKNFVRDRNSTLPFFYSAKYLLEGNALINAALNAHETLYNANLNKNLSERAGASGVVAIQHEHIVSILLTGNCRAYILRNGKLNSLFVEDSFQFLSNDLYNSHLKNIPLSGFGLFSDFHYQFKEVRIKEGDSLLFITDGVYGRVDEHEIEANLVKPTINIKSKIDQLFELSNQRGNLDNQTCMLLEF